MKISQADCHPVFPEPLLYTHVPTQIVFRLQSEIVPENLVLTARRTEPRRNAGMQRCVCLVDFVTPREPISPDATELVEVIEASARDKNQIVDWR